MLLHDCLELFLRGQAKSSNANHCRFISKLKNKKEFHEEVKPQRSVLRDINSQYDKSYIMPQSTDLFFHTIFLLPNSMCKQVLVRTSSQILMEHIPRHDCQVKEGDSVSSP